MFAVTCTCGNTFSAAGGGEFIRCPVCARRLDRDTHRPIEPDFGPDAPRVLPEGELRLRNDERIRVEQVDSRFLWHDDGPEPYAIEPSCDIALSPMTLRESTFYGTIGILSLKKRANCLAYGAHAQWALAGLGDDVQILNMRAGELAGVFREHRRLVTSVGIAADGVVALSGDAAGNLLCWELPSRAICKRWLGPVCPIRAVAMSPDQGFAVSGDEDGAVRFWPMISGAETVLPRVELWDEPIATLAFAADGSLLFIGGAEGRVEVWSVRANRQKRRFTGAFGAITSFHCDGTRLIAAANPSAHGTLSHAPVWCWNLDSGRPSNLPVPADLPRCIPSRAVLSADGTRLIVAGYYPHFELEHYLPGRALVKDLTKDFRDGIADFLGIGDDSEAETLPKGAPPALEIWSLKSGRRLYSYENLDDQIEHLAVSPENTRLIASLANGRAQAFAMAGV